MGYRHYFYELDKQLVEKIRKCKTEKDFVSLMEKENPSIISKCEDDVGYVPLYEMGRCLYEFGKNYEGVEEMYLCGDSLFYSTELNRRYEDYGAIVVGRDGVKCAIDCCKRRVISIYQDLLRETSEYEFDTRSQLDRLKEHAADYLRWWTYSANGPADMDLSHDNLSASWLYEHEFFDLVRIYKTFDFENKAIMFMGW